MSSSEIDLKYSCTNSVFQFQAALSILSLNNQNIYPFPIMSNFRAEAECS